MARSIAPLFALYILTPGRRIYALRRVAEKAADHELMEFAPGIEIAIAHDRETLDLDATRREGVIVEVREHDGEVDRTLGAIQALISHFASGKSKDATATALLGQLFPNGLAAHVHLAHVEQAAANERVLKILEGEVHKEWLDKHGVRPLIEELRSNHDEFDAAMKARDAAGAPTYETIKLRRDRGQDLYLEVVAHIVAQLRDKPEVRDDLLEPIRAQDLRIQHYRRQRRSVVDVNPETGEELEPTDGSDPLNEDSNGSGSDAAN